MRLDHIFCSRRIQEDGHGGVVEWGGGRVLIRVYKCLS